MRNWEIAVVLGLVALGNTTTEIHIALRWERNGSPRFQFVADSRI